MASPIQSSTSNQPCFSDLENTANRKRKAQEQLPENPSKYKVIDVTLNTVSDTLIKHQISATPIKSVPFSKHLVKKTQEDWGDKLGYGDSDIFNRMFEEKVIEAVSHIKNNGWNGREVVSFFENSSREIAEKRGNKVCMKFGQTRIKLQKFIRTPLSMVLPYKDALPKVLMHIPDEKNSVSGLCINGHRAVSFIDNSGLFSSFFKGWYVAGSINEQKIPLTQYLFFPYLKSSKYHIECAFGRDKKCFYYDENRQDWYSGIMLHTDNALIPTCMEHIKKLIDSAIKGDVTAIPHIHWWYVQLAPTFRGAGSIAEMITNSLCRLHGINLPGWEYDIMPAVETLIEPDENKYCENYHNLFESDQNTLQKFFKNELTDEDKKALPVHLLADL